MKKLFAIIISSILTFSVSACNSLRISPTTEQADYSPYFNGINGCAVFFDYNNNTYSVYNEEQCSTRYSPCSTFKIVAALEGLKSGVISSETSTMHYNGQKYPFESWEKNLNLKEAFQNSCVWYFRQVIDGVGQETMSEDLSKLKYGNSDVSQWEGSGIGETPDTNGFWLGSSLEITPVEMVNVISDIFEGKTDYNIDHINILKNIMESDTKGIYGKTGTGRDNTAWYTGFYEKDNSRIYFAVHLDDKTKDTIAGANAKEIAVNIIKSCFY